MTSIKETPTPPQQVVAPPLSISELTTVLIKHYGVKEGLYEASFSMGITVGGFQTEPSGSPYPGAAVFVQGVGLQAVPAPTPHSVDASKVT